MRPGHIFPLIAKDGGVLMRSGHTEAAVDLCRLAGLPPVGVICELANDDGTVMKGEQIDAFAEKHGLKRISVADLIAYRQAREKLVERIATFPVETEWGAFTGYAYSTPFDSVQHVALVYGRIGDGTQHAGAPAPGERGHRRVRGRQDHRGRHEALRQGGPGRPRLSARRHRGVLGVVSIRNLATSTRSYVGLSGFGIEMMAEETLDG